MTALLLAGGAPAAQVARLEVLDAPDTVVVGRPLRVLLTVRPPAGAYPLIPSPGAGAGHDSAALRLGDATVVGLERRPPAFVAGARLDSAVYTVALFALDSALVGPVPVRLVAGEDTASVSAAAVTVRITPVTTPQDSLRPPGPPLEVPGAWGPAALLAAALVGSLALAALELRRRRRRPAAPSAHAHLPPYEEALARIDALECAPVTTAADVESHHVELADAVRTYLERAHGLSAHRLTTSGLVAAMAAAGMDQGARAGAAAVLREADLVKFAARRPDVAALAAARARAREALEALHPAATVPPA